MRILDAPAFITSANVSPLLQQLIIHACATSRLNRKFPPQSRLIGVLMDQLQVAHSVPLQLPYPADPRGLRVARAVQAEPGERVSLDRLSRGSGASKRTIERIFLAETKMSFRHWRQQSRLLHALENLAAGEKVTTAALNAGYHSPSAFIAMFRRQLGSTPARYFTAQPRSS
jgi:AraC-like DNA-binding protein